MQMKLRGASTDEKVKALMEIEKKTAKHGRLHSSKTLEFKGYSPVNNKYYDFKTIEVIFVEENTEIVVITVKVYYH